ncbi:MAG: short chain dehydrogenase [Thermoleophilia bacterium]|nr:short chain dehydrogenase [Thermoleophilia bacterium]
MPQVSSKTTTTFEVAEADVGTVSVMVREFPRTGRINDPVPDTTVGMDEPTDPRTIVITGASSGIGLATALAFAGQGANLVLAARGLDRLADAAAQCRDAGATEVLTLGTDTADAAQVERLATAAVDRFGAIDVWVNNAAVAMFGRFEDLPAEDLERIVDTNINGYAYGCQSALRRFRRKGRGTLINVGSANGKIGSPFSTSYVLTKFAITGMSEALRMELCNEPDIHVCTVLPASIDTPLYANAANYTGELMGPAGPVFSAEQVADAIVECATSHAREVRVGWTGQVGEAVHLLSAPLYETAGARAFPMSYARGYPAAPTSGNLHEPAEGPATIDDGWRSPSRSLLRSAGSLGKAAVDRVRKGPREVPPASASIWMPASPERVYEVLADADSYADWVVSAKEIRSHDAEWPEPGTTFHHTQGAGPLQLHDSTTVMRAAPEEEIVLQVRGRPLMTATTTISLEPVDGGTQVTMSERPTSGLVRAVYNPLLHRALEARNQESLRRLRDVVVQPQA